MRSSYLYRWYSLVDCGGEFALRLFSDRLQWVTFRPRHCRRVSRNDQSHALRFSNSPQQRIAAAANYTRRMARRKCRDVSNWSSTNARRRGGYMASSEQALGRSYGVAAANNENRSTPIGLPAVTLGGRAGGGVHCASPAHSRVPGTSHHQRLILDTLLLMPRPARPGRPHKSRTANQ